MDAKYIAALNGTLLSFQMIEEGLKVIVGLSYEIIAESTPSPVRFNFSRKTILEAPLGKLIQMYSQVSENKEMATHLRKITKWRNFCAHNAFRHELYVRTSKQKFSRHTHEDLVQVMEHCSDLVQHLGSEIVMLQKLHKLKIGSGNDNT